MEELYDFWFTRTNSNLWFNASYKDDIMIYNKFSLLFNNSIDTDLINQNYKYGIGVIILYDQITRHIIRVIKDDLIFNIERNNFIQYYNNIAIQFSKQIYSVYNCKLSADEFAFVMLPLRHSKIFSNIKYVLLETWNMIRLYNKLFNDANNNELCKLKKFLKATYDKSLKQINDSINLVHYPQSTNSTNSTNSIDINKFKNAFYKYNSILDIKCTISQNQNQIENKDNISLINIFNQYFLNYTKNIDPLILSISGGIDSIIASFILVKLNIQFVCVHINYMNRSESLLEEEFVIKWCKIINTQLYIRRIDEINRPMCMKYNMRELYEDYTREIRYGAYININKLLGFINPNVILGHNQDDCFENILTNISHKSKFDNLWGMDYRTSINLNNQIINFIRPMLNISKQQIYQLANINKIPFLCDSTPKWSERGKIRDIIRPILHNSNNNIINGLFEVSNQLKESFDLIDILVDTWIEKINHNKITIQFDKIPNNKIFWKKFFDKLNMKCTLKSVEYFVIKMHKIKANYSNIEINAIEKYQLNAINQIKFLKTKNNDFVFIL